MFKNRTLIPTVILMTIVVGVILHACGNKKAMSNKVIVQNESFTLTGDSLIEGDILAYAVSPEQIESNASIDHLDSLYRSVDSARVKFVKGKSLTINKNRPADMPQYQSKQMLVDALYNMSIDGIVNGVNSNGRFTPKSNISRLYCAIYLSLAHLKPKQSMATLRSMVDKDSIIMQYDGQWPVVSDHIGWATAAWEVYKATGSREWLAYSYHVIKKTLGINSKVLKDYTTGLVHGAGHTTSRPLGQRRMTWMRYNDLFACMSLGNNILTAHAYSILNEMGEELSIENEYDKDAQRIKDAINQHLWNEKQGLYSSFLYGMAFLKQSPITDNTSQAMCVLWGIADDDRAENLIAHTPISNYGVNVTYPASNPIEPFFVNNSWATTQALWNVAAANTDNENALRRGLGAMYRAQALYQSRGIHLQGVETDQLGSGASNVAMVLRVLIGMNFKPEGIEFAPKVPVGMPGKKTFTNFKYRNAVLNITIDGTGNDIQSMTDNDNPVESRFLPCDIEGEHDIVITLRNNQHATQNVTVHHNEVIMPPTPQVTWEGDSGHIVNFVPGTRYRLSVNGTTQSLSDSVFALPHTDGFTEFSVDIAGKYCYGFMSKPLFNFNLTPQMAFIPDSVGGSTTIEITVAQGGDYLLDIGYHPTGTLDVRAVYVNTHPMGTVVMVKVDESDLAINGLAYSNMIGVKLLKGTNVIELQQVRLPKSFTSCEPRHLRVIKK